MNGILLVLAYADDVNITGDHIATAEINTAVIRNACMDIG
jgi:hypothetical protein